MALATLSIDLVAKLAQFERDLGQAARASEKAAAQMEAAFKTAGAALKLLTQALSVKLIIDYTKSIIDAADSLRDMGQAAGVDVVTLGGLGFAASQAGGSMESMATAAKKLNKSLADAAAGNKEALEPFKQLGISVLDAEGKTKTLDAAMVEIADKFATYGDGPEKVAIALRLFGKAGEEQIALLNEGGQALLDNIEYYKRFSGVTKDVTDKADTFNDTLGKLNLLGRGLGTTIIADLLPAIQAIAGAFLKAKEESEAFSIVSATVKTVLETVAILGANVLFVFSALGREIAAWAAQLVALSKGNWTGFTAISDAVKEDGKRAREELDAFERRVLGLGNASGVNERAAARLLRQTGNAGIPKPSAPRLPGGPAEPEKDKGTRQAESELDKYIKTLEAAVEKTQNLTEVQKAQQRISEASALGFSEEKREYILKLAAQKDAADLEVEIAKIRQKTIEMHEKHIDSLSKENDAIAKSNQKLQEQLEEIGLLPDALQRLRRSRLDTALAEERVNLINAQTIEGNEAEIAQIERRIRLKERELELVDATADKETNTQRTQALAQSIEDGILSGFRNSKSIADVFIDELKAQFAKTVLRPIIQPIAEAGNMLLSGIFKSALGSLGLPGFATGIDYVPQDMVAKIHRGERVLTAEENRKGMSTAPAVVNNNYFTVGDVASVSFVKRAVAASQRQVQAATQRSLNYGGILS